MVNYSAMKLGKGPAIRDKRTLALADYTVKLADAPKTCDLTSKMAAIGMMCNDIIGDCTCAAVGHIIQQWTAENGNQVILSDSTIVDLYCKVSGYTPADPSTDNGAVELDVLKYWQNTPIDTHELDGYAYINSHNMQELENAVYYFGAAYVGVLLPVSCQNQLIWDVVDGPDSEIGSWGGHAIPIVAYDELYVYCITWGAIKKMTKAFYLKYCDEAYALLSKDWVCQVNGKCPDGFDFESLKSDLAAIHY